MSQEEAALAAIDALAQLLAKNDVVSIDYRYDEPGTLAVRVSAPSLLAQVRNTVPVTIAGTSSDGRSFTFKVDVRLGPEIKPQIANAEPESTRPRLIPAQGGDALRVVGKPGYGTAGVFFGGIQMEVVTRLGTKYVCAGSNVVLSCNHVIADLDALGPGTQIESISAPVLQGVLGSYFPVGDILVHMDFALGINFPAGQYNHGALRNLGGINPVIRNPADAGEPIRKSGARTGVTAGNTTGRTSIQAPGKGGSVRWYQGVYSTTRGFSRPGDSGSIVIGNGNHLVGMISWGDVPDDGNQVSYFFTFGSQWPFIDGTKLDLTSS